MKCLDIRELCEVMASEGKLVHSENSGVKKKVFGHYRSECYNMRC